MSWFRDLHRVTAPTCADLVVCSSDRTQLRIVQIELRKYLESVYGLSVNSLRTLNYEGTKKRGKHGFYRRPEYKKVYVTFKNSGTAQSL